MTSTELATFATEANGGASIGSTFLFQLFNICRALVELRGPGMVLRARGSPVRFTGEEVVYLALIVEQIEPCSLPSRSGPATGLLSKPRLSTSSLRLLWPRSHVAYIVRQAKFIVN
jgi:hypothetical protein